MERALSREQFEEEASKGPDVRSRVDRLAKRLLRAHITGRTENTTGEGLVIRHAGCQ
jgi:hypothetical protein